MGRRLPDDPTKRRIQLFKRVYQHLPHFHALMESGEMAIDGIVAIEGEEICLGDLMVGIDTLPKRQRQAFELICLQGYTESAATAIMLPDSKWSTPVQQYSDMALVRMIAAYDAVQAGTWESPAKRRPGQLTVKVSVAASASQQEEMAHVAVRDQGEVRSGLRPRGPGRRDSSTGAHRGDPPVREAGLSESGAARVAV